MTFQSPNYTQTPNDLFDLHMASMTGAELKVVMAAVRKTVGFHKKRETISISQFQQLTGLSRQGVLDAIDDAKTHGFLKEVGTGKRGAKRYELSIQSNELTSQESRPELVKKVDQSMHATSQKSRHTKESIKETPKKKEATLSDEEQKTSDAVSFFERVTKQLIGSREEAILLKELYNTVELSWLEEALAKAASKKVQYPVAYAEKVIIDWRTNGHPSLRVVAPPVDMSKVTVPAELSNRPPDVVIPEYREPAYQPSPAEFAEARRLLHEATEVQS